LPTQASAPAHEVHAGALDGGPEHLGCGGLQPLVVVGDDQTGAAQAAIGEGAQELVPEDLRLAGLDGDAQDLAPAIQVDRNGHYGRDGDDAPGTANLDAGGIEPQVGPFAFKGAVQERIDPFIDLAAEPGDLALGDAGHAHGLDQVVHRTCRHTLDTSLLDDCRHGLLRRPAGLQELGEAAAFAQLGDLHVNPARARLPRSAPISVSMVDPLGAALVRPRPTELIDVQRHEAVGDEPEHLGQQLGVGRFRQKRPKDRGL